MRRFATTLMLMSLLGACDRGPDGPGDLAASLETPGVPVGGMVLDVVGAGIEGFSGEGGSRVFWVPQESPSAYRVVVIGPEGSDPAFAVSVEDVGRRFPRTTVVSIVNRDNLPVPVTEDYQVRFNR